MKPEALFSTLGHIRITQGAFKHTSLISKPYNQSSNNGIPNGRGPSNCSFKSSPGDSNVHPGLGITRQCKYCRNIKGKIFVALNAVRQK